MYIRKWQDNEMFYSVLSPTTMRCSGLRDKNERLIYENDIVKDITGHLDKIIFHDGSFQLQSFGDKGYTLDDLRDTHHHLEVVGNTYQSIKLKEQSE
jgi:hypothetical protein